jgi:hypothetical protein
MAVFAGFGALGSVVLILRSRVKSPFWANCLLFSGIFLIAIGVCAASILLDWDYQPRSAQQ